MSYIFKPRRGNIDTMTSSSTVLATGELFLEYPSGGVGTGDSNIKIGDGSTAYSSLPYAIGSQAPVTFSSTTETDNSTILDTIISGASSATMFGAIKNLLTNLNSSITSISDDITDIDSGISTLESTSSTDYAEMFYVITLSFSLNATTTSKYLSVPTGYVPLIIYGFNQSYFHFRSGVTYGSTWYIYLDTDAISNLGGGSVYCYGHIICVRSDFVKNYS